MANEKKNSQEPIFTQEAANEIVRAAVEAALARLQPTMTNETFATQQLEANRREIQKMVNDGSLWAAQDVFIVARSRAWPSCAGVLHCVRSRKKTERKYRVIKVAHPVLSPELIKECVEPTAIKYAQAIMLAEQGKYRTAEGVFLTADHFRLTIADESKQAIWERGWQFMLKRWVGQNLDELIAHGEIVPLEAIENEDAPWSLEVWTAEADPHIAAIPPEEMKPGPDDPGQWLVG